MNYNQLYYRQDLASKLDQVRNQLQINHSHGNSHCIVASSVNSRNQTVQVHDSVNVHLDKNTEKIIQIKKNQNGKMSNPIRWR